MLPPSVDDAVSTSGDSPVTTIDSRTAEGTIWKLRTAVCPTRSVAGRVTLAKP